MATRIAIEEPYHRGPPSTASPDESTRAARHDGAKAAPLSFAQERLWFLDQLEPQLPVYNVPRAMHLSGALDPAILDRALNEVARRHGSLRTTFGLVDGVPQQFVAPSLHLRCVVRDLRELPEPERRAAAARQASIEAATPFDLHHGPLVRALLLRLAAEESILVITMHHIVSEGGWSMNIFLRELCSLYTAFQRGESSSLAPLPIQYHEYAAWQREELDDDKLTRDLEYWREQLRGVPTVIELPGDRSRSAARGYRGNRTELRLPHHLSERIRALSRAEGATVTMALLAGWAAVVARYTGSSDLLFGMPVAGRSRLETEALIGLFLNTLVLRVDCSGDPSFRELLGRIRSVALGAYDHQELPFERLVKELRPERVGSRTPLVQLIFAPQPPARTSLSLPDINVRPYELGTGTTIADATLFSWDEPDGIRLVLEYSSELFEPERMQRMLAHYQTILEGAAACPTLSLSELPLLTDMERYRLLVEWNTGSHGGADGRCIHELVGEVAKRSPGATAVAAAGERVTYAELNVRAELLASRLRALGVGPDVIVGIATERSVEMVVGLLGILKAGGAYLPLDPAYPADRLAFMLADSGTNLLLTQRHLVPRLPEFGGTIIELDEESEPGTRETAALPGRSVSACDLAYVIYTSGSTGRPKGVQITHGALANLLASARELVEMTREDVMLAVTTLSFDIAGLEIWLPLMTGARVVVASRAAASDGEQLGALLRDAKATIMQATPATWQLLLRSGWKNGASLRVLCGGEALPWELAARLLANGCSVWNMYGPTETTIWSTAHHVSPADCGAGDDGSSVPIGRPLANTELYVLDARRQLLPVGVPGELYIGGAGLARGYLDRAELTAERFVPHPFDAGPGTRLYRTGDRVRYREDGTLEFIGRVDHQIKLRGFRIEPGEIEATLRDYPGVRESVVVVRDDEEREPALVAYLVRKEGSELSLTNLLEHAKRQLPSYMVPSALVEISEVPLTPAGKVDRRALPAPTRSDTVSRDRYVAPRNDIEARLIALWERVLGIEPIGVRDNFFQMGGHSLLVARLFGEIEATFGERLPLAAIFDAPTIEELAVMLQGSESSRRWTSLVSIQEGGTRPPLFLVHGMGGNVVGYGNLVRLLGPDQPCYAFQARGLDGATTPARSIEEMAANYNAELRAAWPRGPYALCGLSFGGTVAFEMARQLEAAGQRVALLALLDSCPTYEDWALAGNGLRHRTAHTASILAYHARALRTRSPREMLHYLHLVTRRQVAKVRSVVWRQRQRLRPTEQIGKQPLSTVLRNVEESCRMAFRSYRPQPYSGRITLFRAEIRGGDEQDLATAWRRLARGGLDVLDMPGTHLTMMSSANISHFAEKLRARLAEAFAAAERDAVRMRKEISLPPSSGSS